MSRVRSLLLGMLLSSPAQAADISWAGAADCRRELEVVEQVESMTQRHLAEVDIADFELTLERLDETRLRLSLATVTRAEGARSLRTFEGGACADVTDAPPWPSRSRSAARVTRS